MPVSKNETTNPHEERGGTTMSGDIRVACCLSDAELRKRVATLLARFGSAVIATERSEEHTSELQSHLNLVCRLLLEKKKIKVAPRHTTLCAARFRLRSRVASRTRTAVADRV